MASLNKQPRSFIAHNHSGTPCTRTHQIGALLLVAATFFLTRVFDQSVSPCANTSLSVNNYDRTSQIVERLSPGAYGGPFSWPQRGYGSDLSIKIYVYDQNEIDGLKDLMYGRDGNVKTNACLKGQWGTQVISNFTDILFKFHVNSKECYCKPFSFNFIIVGKCIPLALSNLKLYQHNVISSDFCFAECVLGTRLSWI